MFMPWYMQRGGKLITLNMLIFSLCSTFCEMRLCTSAELAYAAVEIC